MSVQSPISQRIDRAAVGYFGFGGSKEPEPEPEPAIE